MINNRFGKIKNNINQWKKQQRQDDQPPSAHHPIMTFAIEGNLAALEEIPDTNNERQNSKHAYNDRGCQDSGMDVYLQHNGPSIEYFDYSAIYFLL